jgi:hypothetical protein
VLTVWVTGVAAAYASIVLGACGAAGTSEVASVQGAAISRAALAHWTQIKRLEANGSSGARPTASPVQLQRKALVFLITADWLQAEAKARGVDVSASEVDTTFRELLNGPTGQSFAISLRNRGISSADELLLIRLQQLSNKLQAKIAAGDAGISAARIAAYYRAHTRQLRGPSHRRQTLRAATPAIRRALLESERERQVATFAVAYRQRWKLRTSCQPGYIIPECRNGPPLPSSTG